MTRRRGRVRVPRATARLGTVLMLGAFALGACGSETVGTGADTELEGREATVAVEQDGMVIATSFSVLEDLVSGVAGDAAEVRSLTPLGAEVHEWELSPRNFADLSEADAFFYNGYQLEQWLGQALEVLEDDVPRVAVAPESGWPTIPIRVGDLEGSPDPHLWMHPEAAARYVEVVADALSEIDPERESVYRENARELSGELRSLYEELKEEFAGLESSRRVLISSEAAFLYFADAFDLEHDGIWGSNAEEEGTPDQMARIIDRIDELEPGAIFYESTVSERYALSVSEETGVPVRGPLYVDSVSEPEEDAPTYQAMMRHNMELLLRELR